MSVAFAPSEEVERTSEDTTATRLAIEAVRVGQRHRAEMGDVAALARSIRDVGLLHPIVVTPAGELIAGARRLAACRLLGWTEMPVTVVSLDEIERGEWAENAQRKDFTPSEKVAIGRLLEDRERERARERQRLAGQECGRGIASGNFPEAIETGRASDKIGHAVGVSGRTYDRMKLVVEASEADPDTFGPDLFEMDRSGRVSAVYQRVRRKQAAPAVQAPAPAKARKTRTATAERRERIVSMAREGYREESIASAVGVGVQSVRLTMRAAGVPTLAQKIGKSARIDADRVMEGLVSQAEPSAPALAALEWRQLDRSRLGVWEERLTSAIRSLTQLRNRLREAQHDD